MAKQQADKFPAIGTTLQNYQYDPRDKHKRAAATAVKTSRWQRFKEKFRLKRAVITLAVLLALIVGFVGVKFIYNAHKLFGGNILGVLTTTKLKGEDRGRVNILLAGNSADDAGHNGGQLTDSIMVMSIDTKNNKAFLLSIPRDLLVADSSGDYEKINAAYVDGQNNNFHESGYPSGGMGQLEKTVSDNLGISINYYALIDYSALKQAVDAVGGIDFTVASDDPRGLYDPNIDYSTPAHGPLVKLTNGVHHLNGQQALNLSRARGDSYRSYGFAGSDFTRTENQRKLLIALKTKAVSAGVITNPAKLSSLSDAIGNNVKTDLKLPEVHRLYDVTKPIGSNNIKSLSLNDADGKNLLTSYSSPSLGSGLIPAAGIDDYSDIQAFLKRQTSSNPVVQEGATVTVLNATDTGGLASKKRTQLQAKEINVVSVGDANANQATTTIIDNSGGKSPATKQLLISMFGNSVTTTNPYSGLYTSDYIVLVGADQVPKTTTTQ